MSLRVSGGFPADPADFSRGSSLVVFPSAPHLCHLRAKKIKSLLDRNQFRFTVFRFRTHHSEARHKPFRCFNLKGNFAAAASR